MKKKNKNILLGIGIILGIIVSIYFLNYFGVFSKLPFFSVSTSTGSEIVDQGQSPSYNCPIGVSYCRVKGVMDCNLIKAGSPKVIARTDNSDFSDGWIAIYNENSQSLQSYCDGGSISSTSISKSDPINLPFGVIGYLSYGPFNPCRDTKCIYIVNTKYSDQNHYFEFEPKSCGADLTPTPKYNCQNQEKCEGEISGYSCSGDFLVNDAIKDSLSYSSTSTPGTRETSWFKINVGDSAEFLGGDSSYTKYEAIKEYQICFENFCQGEEGYIECVNNKPGEFIPCTGVYKCSNGKCVPPIDSIDITIKDGSGKEKAGFILDEDINIFVKIVSGFTSMNVKMQLREGSVDGNVVYEQSKLLGIGELKKFEVSGISEVGTYYVILEIDVGLTEKVYYGRETEEKKSFRVSPSVVLSAPLPYSPTTGTNLFTDSPVYIDLKARDENNNPVQITNYNIDVKLNGQSIQDAGYVQPLPEPGLYRFVYAFASPGLMTVTASIEKFGVWSKPISYESEIKNLRVITTFTNIGLFRSISPSTQTIKFETKNPFNDYIDTTNIVKVIPPGASTGAGDIDVSSSVQKVGMGKYEFSHNFDKIGGYQITIQSTAPGYPVGDQPASGTLTVIPGGEPDECVTSEDCSTNEACVNGKCQPINPPYYLYMFIIGSVILVIILIFVIIKLRKKKSSEVNIGL